MTTTRNTLPFFIVPFALTLVVIAGCGRDASALTTQMRDRCGVVLFAPLCTADEGNEAGEARAFERFIDEAVTTQDTEQCVLDVDCSEARVASDRPGAVEDVLACNTADPAVQARRAELDTRDTRCLQECDIAFFDCGQNTACDAGVVDACFDAQRACLDACPPAAAS